MLEHVLEHYDIESERTEWQGPRQIHGQNTFHAISCGEASRALNICQDVDCVRGKVASEPSGSSTGVKHRPASRDPSGYLGRVGRLPVPGLVGDIGQEVSFKGGRAMITVDLRRLEPYVTGMGLTIRESLPLLRPEDQLIVRSRDERLPMAQLEQPANSRAITFEGLRGRRVQGRLWQPWMFGPLGSTRTLLGVYDLIPLRLGAVKARILGRRLSVIRENESVHVLTLLQGTRARLVSEFGVAASRVHVVSPGVDHIIPPEVTPSFLPRYVLVVARNSAHKNLRLLIRAWEYSGKAVGLTMVLPPKDAESTFGLRASSKGVKIMHSLSNFEIGKLMAGATCVMSPSLEEGFGLPAVEAASARKPIFASSIPAYSEIPVRDAVLIPPTKLDAWVAAFHQVASGAVTPARLYDNAPTWADWRRELGGLLNRLRTET